MNINTFWDKPEKLNSYSLMCKDVELIRFEYDCNTYEITDIHHLNQVLLPYRLIDCTTRGLERWLEDRTLDITRSNARLLLRGLNLPTQSLLQAVIWNKGLSLTDSYWIKYEEKLLYSDVNLSNKSYINSIGEISLNGVLQKLKMVANPEITNIGSFDKAWIKEGDEWWLRKKGSDKNQFAEIFTYHLGKMLGMNMTHYKYKDGYVNSLRFTSDDVHLESYKSFVFAFKDKEYSDDICYKNLKSISQDLANSFADILLLDSIVCNPDRHEDNWGILRDSSTGEILSLAPNFDNNLAFGGDSKWSPFLLKAYIKTIGILPHQQKYIDTITPELIYECYQSTVTKLNLPEGFLLEDIDKIVEAVNTLLK